MRNEYSISQNLRPPRHHILLRLCALSFLSILSFNSFASDGIQDPSKVDPVNFSVPTNAETALSFFSAPRFSVLSLSEDSAAQALIERTVRKDNYSKLQSQLKTSRGAANENAYWVAKFHSLEMEVEAARKNWSSQPSEQERVQGTCDFIDLIAAIASGFESVAHQGHESAQLNHWFLLKTIKRLQAQQILFDSTRLLEQPSGIDLSHESLRTIQAHAQILDELTAGIPTATEKVDRLVEAHHWPAIEVRLRDAYEAGNIGTVEKYATRLIDMDDLDATAKCLAAGGAIQAARAQGVAPVDGVKQAGQEAIESGVNLGFLVLAHYLDTNGDYDGALRELQNGALAGNKECFGELIPELIKNGEYSSARDVFTKVNATQLLLFGPERAEAFASTYSTLVINSCSENLKRNTNINFAEFESTLMIAKFALEQIAQEYDKRDEAADAERAEALASEVARISRNMGRGPTSP